VEGPVPGAVQGANAPKLVSQLLSSFSFRCSLTLSVCFGLSSQWNSRDEEPRQSWKDLYVSSPCVPVDYSTIDRALAAVPNPSTIWLRPGHECVLERPITVTADMKICVMAVPVAHFRAGSGRRHVADSGNSSRRDPSHRAKALAADDHQHPDVGVVDETWRSSDDSSDEEEWPDPTGARGRTNDVPEQALSRPTPSSATSNSRALVTANTNAAAPRPCTLVLHTRQMNSPVIWVQSGCLTLERVVLSHACLGVDIWNGNAALQIQPVPAAAPRSLAQPLSHPPLPPPRAVLTGCQVTSQSGRGVVVMDGGRVTIQKSSVMDCAATGVYIGGPHSPVAPPDAAAAAAVPPPAERRRSRADLVDSQVSGNGIGSYYREALAASAVASGPRGLLRGNRLPRRPSVIARGHSGVYLEQGDCHIASSVIRSNALTGISAVSDQARLVVTGSTLDSNGSQQLETVPSRFVRLENNRIVDLPPPFPRPAVAPHRAWGPPHLRQDIEDLDDFVRMVMDQP
jgi:Right handed beta helix region